MCIRDSSIYIIKNFTGTFKSTPANVWKCILGILQAGTLSLTTRVSARVDTHVNAHINRSVRTRNQIAKPVGY